MEPYFYFCLRLSKKNLFLIKSHLSLAFIGFIQQKLITFQFLSLKLLILILLINLHISFHSYVFYNFMGLSHQFCCCFLSNVQSDYRWFSSINILLFSSKTWNSTRHNNRHLIVLYFIIVCFQSYFLLSNFLWQKGQRIFSDIQ